MCNAVVDPLPYITACQYDTCKSSDPNSAACPSFESYARECSRYQVCLSWRSSQLCPIECPSGMEYQQCGSGCQSICGQDKDLTFTCPMSVNDGCYCPAGHAFNQDLGRCVPQDHCEPCDTEGHYKGPQHFVNF
jgi:von Willebrand factor